jgi:hypothetical protein
MLFLEYYKLVKIQLISPLIVLEESGKPGSDAECVSVAPDKEARIYKNYLNEKLE